MSSKDPVLRNHPQFDRNESATAAEENFVLSHAVAAVRRYRRPIFLALAAVLLAELILGLAYYLLSPSSKIARVPFRLEFTGAEKGEYPNALKFNSAEIVSTSVLNKVFEANSLGRYTKFDKFKNSIFVSESNETLDSLAREYGAKLADPRLTPVDRDRIESEYASKRKSLSHSDFSITLVQSDRGLGSIPQDLVEKSLKDIVATWAEQVFLEKGALEYRLPVMTARILDTASLSADDPVVRVDALRTKFNKVLTNVDEMLLIPGAEVLRTKEPERISLAEVRVNLEDTLRFTVEPLFETIAVAGLLRSPEHAQKYLQVQIDYTDRRVQEEEGRVQALREAFNAYVKTQATAENPTLGAAPASSATPITPQVNENFINQIVRMVTETKDFEYRQKTSEEIARVVSMQLLPVRAEATYYRQVREMLKTARAGTASAASEQAFRGRYDAALADLRRGVGQVQEIYRLLSRNLNPGNVVYRLTGPVEYRTQRAVAARKLALYGLLLFLLAIPAVLAATLLHNRLREEETLDAQMHTEA